MALRNLLLAPNERSSHGRAQAHQRIIPVDKATARPRPAEIGDTYGELAHDAHAEAQVQLHQAEAEQVARSDAAVHIALKPYDVESALLIDENRQVVTDARRYYLRVSDALSPWRRRKGSDFGYRLRACALFGGEVMGPANAAILYGDIPVLAVIQAVSAGMATVTAGLTGAEYKYRQLATERKRHDPDKLPDNLQSYRHLFDGSSLRAGRFVTFALAAGATVGLLVATAILSLRSAVDGAASGLAFGALAFAVTIASFINSYCRADQVSDLIDEAHGQYKKELRAHRRLPAHILRLLSGRATERARSIAAEQRHRGEAAGAHIEALSFEALTGSPDVVGHGPAAPAIGRKLRQDAS